MIEPRSLGRTIQIFLADGVPNGLVIASIHGWTGSVMVATQSTFARLTARAEADRTGVYILYGPDPDNPLQSRAYIGEADSVRDRIKQSANERGFWELAAVVTTSDEALTKGHVRYLEARLIEITKAAGRVSLDNGNAPEAERRRLPEADRANMEAFLDNLRVILPVVGFDLLKPRPKASIETPSTAPTPDDAAPRFEIRHKSGVQAVAVEEDGEFVVLEGSEALKDTDFVMNSYAGLKQELIDTGVLAENAAGDRWVFTRSYTFRSPSAAAATVLDRNANGRTRWLLVGTRITYHQWQEQSAKAAEVSA